MSYSSWNDSRWHSYWSVTTRSFITHSTCGSFFEFSYQELKENINSILEDIVEEIDPTDAEIEELKGYMNEFLKDFESKFDQIK